MFTTFLRRFLVLLVTIYAFVAEGYVLWSSFGPRMPLERNRLRSSSEFQGNEASAASGSSLDRELNTFFERAAESGSRFASKLTPQERVERTIRGEELENEIFAMKDRIADLGRIAMTGDNAALEEIKTLRERIKELKEDYIAVVGGNNLPIYFGKVPDSLQ